MVHEQWQRCVSVFVNNLSERMNRRWLKQLFGYHGEVVDIFIPNKRTSAGMRFGFVRFTRFDNANRAIDRSNGFILLKSRKSSGVDVEVDAICVEGETKQDDEGGCNGDSMVLLVFQNVEKMNITISSQGDLMKKWFVKMQVWSESIRMKNHRVWLSCFGVPVHDWNILTFQNIAGRWGDFISFDGKKTSSIMSGNFQVIIEDFNRINKVIDLKVRNQVYFVHVKELDFNFLRWDNLVEDEDLNVEDKHLHGFEEVIGEEDLSRVEESCSESEKRGDDNKFLSRTSWHKGEEELA
ncbi:hypothetical protein GQ457_12G018390 [Hibiscus cannabinus]